MKKLLIESEGLKKQGGKYMDRGERWKLFCHDQPRVGCSRREQYIRNYR